jgi:hypothetical protein
MYVLKTGCEGRDRVQLSQDRDHWQAVVNRVMNLQVPYEKDNLIR